MRIKYTDPEADNIDAVYINGQRLAMCVEADDKEGWARVLLPPERVSTPAEVLEQIAKEKNQNKKTKFLTVGDPIDINEWIETTLYGEVDIVFREEEGLNSGLEI